MAARKLLARLVATAVSALLANSVNAETMFGIYAGAGTWHQNSEGYLQSNDTKIDTSQDMGLGDDDGNVIAVAFEHPIPFLPNIRLQQAKVGMRGGIDIDRDVVLDGVSFIPPGTVESTLDLKMTDAILYYRVLESALSLDLGFEARKLEGSASISGGIYQAEVEFDDTIPMLYAAAEWELLSGFWMAAIAQAGTWKDDSYLDYSGTLGWNSDLGLGLEVGYRYFRLKLDELDDIEKANLTIDGPFAALNYRF